MEFTKLENINPTDVLGYRGNTGYTTIYLKSGETVYVEEDFSYVDVYFENQQ